MDKFETGFYFSVMGMLIGSPIAILILLNKDYSISSFGIYQWIVGLILLILAFFLILFMSNIEKKKEIVCEK